MAEKKKEPISALSKKRKSFYDFQKEYPSSDYARMRKKYSENVYDTKKKIITAVAIVGFLVLVALSYFVTYTVLNISNAPINDASVSYNVISER